MRFLKKEKDTYIYDGHTSPELIRWYEENVRSEKTPYDECDVDYWLNHCNLDYSDLFWVGVATAPKITSYYMTNEEGKVKKLSRDAVVDWLGMDCILNWTRYLRLITESAKNGKAKTSIKFENNGVKHIYEIEFITKFPRR